MEKSKKSKVWNLLFIAMFALILIPQTRKPIQVFINSGIALIVKPTVIEISERSSISSYDWVLKDISGNDYDFNTAKQKVVIINFWATWCPPCIAEMPSLEKLYQHYKTNDDVEFLFISNEDTNVVYEFMTHRDFDFPVFQPKNDYPEMFDISTIPRTLILDKNGAIVIDKSGAADWNSERVITTIDELLLKPL